MGYRKKIYSPRVVGAMNKKAHNQSIRFLSFNIYYFSANRGLPVLLTDPDLTFDTYGGFVNFCFFPGENIFYSVKGY
jgi:hypothetical protein